MILKARRRGASDLDGFQGVEVIEWAFGWTLGFKRAFGDSMRWMTSPYWYMSAFGRNWVCLHIPQPYFGSAKDELIDGAKIDDDTI